MKLKRTTKVVMIVIACIFVLCAVLYVIVPLVLLGNADKVLATDLDNLYINANYNNWHDITIPEIGTFKIPGDWSLENHFGTYRVVDSEMSDIAVGFELNTSNSIYESDEEFLTSVFTTECMSIQWANAGTFYIELSNFRTMELTSADGAHEFYVISLSEYSKDSGISHLKLFFPADNGMTYDDLYEIAEAVIYSFEF